MIVEPLTVVRVPSSFTDRTAGKRRPALVLSTKDFNQQSGHSLLAMITSAVHTPWPCDHAIQSLQLAGLKSSCIVRMKPFTLDDRLILGKLGTLGPDDARIVCAAMEKVLGMSNDGGRQEIEYATDCRVAALFARGKSV